jgi:hypothetical protein
MAQTTRPYLAVCRRDAWRGCDAVTGRPLPLELWLHGNPCLKDKECGAAASRLAVANPLVLVHL